MKSPSLILLVFVPLLLPVGLAGGQLVPVVPERWNYPLELHESVQVNDRIPVGPFVEMGNGRILSVGLQELMISEDNGESWEPRPIFANPEAFEMPARAVARTKDGVIVVAFYNLKERHWIWSDELQDAPGARLPTYVVRSLEDGQSPGLIWVTTPRGPLRAQFLEGSFVGQAADANTPSPGPVQQE